MGTCDYCGRYSALRAVEFPAYYPDTNTRSGDFETAMLCEECEGRLTDRHEGDVNRWRGR